MIYDDLLKENDPVKIIDIKDVNRERHNL